MKDKFVKFKFCSIDITPDMSEADKYVFIRLESIVGVSSIKISEDIKNNQYATRIDCIGGNHYCVEDTPEEIVNYLNDLIEGD